MGLHHRRQAGGLRLVVKALPRWACYDFLLFSMEGKYGHFMLRLYPAGVT
jgi:capsular polysaccharide biosynthesis protein